MLPHHPGCGQHLPERSQIAATHGSSIRVLQHLIYIGSRLFQFQFLIFRKPVARLRSGIFCCPGFEAERIQLPACRRVEKRYYVSLPGATLFLPSADCSGSRSATSGNRLLAASAPSPAQEAVLFEYHCFLFRFNCFF